MLYWPRGLSSKGKNAAIRRRNHDSNELEVKPVPRTFRTCHASESTGREGIYSAAGMTGPSGKWTITLQWK